MAEFDVAGSGGGALTPWTTLQWGNAVSVAGGEDGTIAFPRTTLQAAIDNVISEGSIPLGVGAYAAITVTNKNLHINGIGGPEGGAGGQAQIAGATLENSFVRIENCALTGDVTGNGTGALFLWNTTLNAGCDISAAGYNVNASSDNQVNILRNVTCDEFIADNMTLSGKVQATDGAIRASRVLDDLTFADSVLITDCVIWLGVTVDCPLITMDASSYGAAQAAGVTFTSQPLLIEGSDGVRNQSGWTGTTVTDALNNATSDNIANASTVDGSTVTDALETLADVEGRAQYYSTGTHTNNSLGSTFVQVNGNAFATQELGAHWTFNATNGVLTYAGPAGRRYLVTATICGEATAGSSAAGFAMDLDSDVLGEDVNTFFQHGVTINNAAEDTLTQLSTTRLITPDVGDTLRPAIAAFDAIDSQWRHFICTVVPYP